ncbi:hypothetical protein PtB15_7B195 [Puccinia triticina]|nr:hypothetical protein PtB15_7B195 [Puccinia triticina]
MDGLQPQNNNNENHRQNENHRPHQALTENEKLMIVCRQLQALDWTPKQFTTAFLRSEDTEFAYRRRFWGTSTGWNSTRNLIEVIKSEVTSSDYGASQWETFIQEEAIRIMINQRPPSGEYPVGSYISSQSVQPSYFSPDAVNQRERLISMEHTPFLFNILHQTIGATVPNNAAEVNEDDRDDMAEPDIDTDEAEFLGREGVAFESNSILRTERGRKVIYQSHKNDITNRSLDMFLRMARTYDLADQHHKTNAVQIPECNNLLLDGLKVLQKDFAKNKLCHLKLHFLWDSSPNEVNENMAQDNATYIEENENEEPQEDNSDAFEM